MSSGIIITFIKNLLVNIMVFLGVVMMPFYYFDSKEMINNIDENTFKSAQTTLAYDVEENVISKLRDEKDSYYLGYDAIPQDIKDIFVATEDKSFFEHNGVDITGVGRAFVNLIKKGKISGGGSTITQQLVRNTFLTHEKSFERKAKEIFISVMLEKEYSKEEILEYYINTIYFNNGAYGIDAASRKYFGKPATELTLGETAFLCAIPNNPSLYNPLTKFDNTLKRQKRMLGYMLEDGYITEEEYNNALAEEIVLSKEAISGSSYVDTFIVDNAVEIIMKMDGFEFKNEFKDDAEKKEYKEKLSQAKKDAQNKLYTSGYRIYTSIDMNKQRALQNALDSNLASFDEKTPEGVYTFQGSATSIDNTTGKVVAIVGGRSQESVKYAFNRAFQSYRQPGSTIKPLVVYTPAFEKNYYPSSILIDAKAEKGPKNLNDTYDGPITLRQAVEQSKNTVAWNLFNEVGISNGLDYILKMNFEKIVEKDYNLASALGGLTYGTNTLEMASAYATLARDGKYVKPTCILKITDSDGNVLYEDKENAVEVYSEKASRIMTDVLSSTMVNGTGNPVQLNNMPSAGKTGSTNDCKDGWFAGYTPYYTTVVWAGYDTPKPVDNLYGSTYPGRAWKQYMDEIHNGLEVKNFAVYEGLQAEEEAMRAQEEQKVLEYEIQTGISLYLSREIFSYDSIAASETLYWSLIDKINRLTDEAKRNDYTSRISEKKAYVDSQKPTYYYY